MTYLIVLGLYFAALFVIGWISRRSLGVPSLALAAGALLASIWTDNLTPLVARTGLIVTQPPLTSIVSISLTLLPAIFVMFRAHKTPSQLHSILGSLAFAALGVVLTYGAFSNAVVLDEQSKQYIVEFVKYQNIIITVGVVLALLSVLLYRKPHEHHEEKRHRKD